MTKAGKNLPGFLEEPLIPRHLVFYWDAFWELSTCRSQEIGGGLIPWTSIDAYCWRWDICDNDEVHDFFTLITTMDQAYLRELRSRLNEREALPARR